MDIIKPFWKKNWLAILILIILGLSLVVYTTARYIHAIQVKGQWGVFDSQNYMNGEGNPDGFRLEFPLSWRFAAYDNGGPKNLKDARAAFDEPFFFFTPTTFLYIWWRRVDSTWTVEDVRDWYIEELGFGINRSLLEQNRHAFREITVGDGNYPALSQAFWQDAHSGTRIVLLVVGDEAFVLDFSSQNFPESSATFNRMLDSFEVYD